MRITGALIYSTACHSVQLRGVIANRVYGEIYVSDRVRTEYMEDTHGEEGDVQDCDMQRHAKCNRADEEGVLPQRQPEQTLVLGERVHRVEHLDDDEDRERHRRRAPRHLVREHLTSDLGEEGRALVEVRLQSQASQFGLRTRDKGRQMRRIRTSWWNVIWGPPE